MSMTATYSPEDNKLRLYSTTRLDKETFAKVKAAGFKWAPKQDLFVAPAWTPQREDLLLRLCEEIDDEDYSPEERAADRAERFSGYRDKRRSEARGHADRFDAGPAAFGHQSQARAERQANRHDRLRTNAVSQWSKAEYWQSRTEGVIAHALFKSSPTTRRGRIKTIEAEKRRIESQWTPAHNPPKYIDDGGVKKVFIGLGRARHPVAVDRLESIKAAYQRWIDHLDLRLAYENAMLEAEGGHAVDVEMIPGGFLGGHQIRKVNKSAATGKVVSVTILHEGKQQHLNIERFGSDVYRAPTAEELEQFEALLKADKAERKATGPKAPPLINPTLEDAQKLQQIWNESEVRRNKHAKPAEVLLATQAEYSENSKGEYSKCKTVEVSELLKVRRGYRRDAESDGRVTVFKVRIYSSGYNTADRVIVLTDKTQKPLPWGAAEEARERCPNESKMLGRLDELNGLLYSSRLPDEPEKLQLIQDADYLGWAYVSSQSQFGWTDKGFEIFQSSKAAQSEPAAV